MLKISFEPWQEIICLSYSCVAMSDIKLYYYQAGGAMDQIRFICAYAGQQFTNCFPEGADPSAFLAECRTKVTHIHYDYSVRELRFLHLLHTHTYTTTCTNICMYMHIYI